MTGSFLNDRCSNYHVLTTHTGHLCDAKLRGKVTKDRLNQFKQV